MSLTLTKCTAPKGPSRFARRASSGAHRSIAGAAPAMLRSVDLGTFEGERKSRCRGYDESYSLTCTLLSLIAVTVAGIAVSLWLSGLILSAR